MRKLTIVHCLVLLLVASLLIAGCGEKSSTVPINPDGTPGEELTKAEAEEMLNKVEELDSLQEKLTGLEHHSHEYIETEGLIISLRSEITNAAPALYDGYDDRGNVKVKSIEECREYLDSIIGE